MYQRLAPADNFRALSKKSGQCRQAQARRKSAQGDPANGDRVLPACNAKASSCITVCIARLSHCCRANFIPQLSVNRRTIASQNPAMTPVLFETERKVT